ncbi:hypothetical protein C6Y14_12800 [Streptomyces dioscori]|uniref:Uncharacterized protein n=1 Tax=Streptomyces dioscori TaxID=2109333 RepID=A0A2P8Q9W7_9ACTN|nr:hypothetical protein C6Y14_12800 [Streptomyces dioscori]
MGGAWSAAAPSWPVAQFPAPLKNGAAPQLSPLGARGTARPTPTGPHCSGARGTARSAPTGPQTTNRPVSVPAAGGARATGRRA